jgi:hypothetical protein
LDVVDTSTQYLRLQLSSINSYSVVGVGEIAFADALPSAPPEVPPQPEPSPVPVPPAVWLFGSGLVVLLELAKRKKA